MSRRPVKLNETIQQLSDVSIADALGFGNIQVIKAGTQLLDINTSLILMTLDVPATIVLNSLGSALLSYPYKIRVIGTAPLEVRTADGTSFDRRLNVSSVSLPPMAHVSFACIEQDDGTREWLVTDSSFSTESFPRLVTNTVFDTSTVLLPLGLITTIGSSVNLLNLPIDPPTGSSIGIRSISNSPLNPTIDAGAGREVQKIGGPVNYSQSHNLGLPRRRTAIFAYCAGSLQWSSLTVTP